MTRLALGVDVGGTKIAAGIVDDEGTLRVTHVVSTPRSVIDDGDLGRDSVTANRTVEAILGAVAHVLDTDLGRQVEGIGVGMPGLVDSAPGVYRYGPHLALRNVPIGDLVADRFGLPIRVENDATTATWAEYLYGAGERCAHMLMVALGTGIGGGIVADGRLYRGAHGYAGEFGHIYVDPKGRHDGHGNRGNWESVASGSALDRLAVELARSSSGGALRAAEQRTVTARDLVRAAGDDDVAATAVLDAFAALVARGLAGLVQAFDPGRIVVGGGVAEAGDLLVAPLRRHLDDLLIGGAHRPDVPVLAARLGPDAGMVGAAALFWTDPSGQGSAQGARA